MSEWAAKEGYRDIVMWTISQGCVLSWSLCVDAAEGKIIN